MNDPRPTAKQTADGMKQQHTAKPEPVETELDVTLQELRSSEQRFRSLVEMTSDWLWEVDAQATYTYSSPKVKDLLGYEPEEVIGKTPFDFMPRAEAERLAALFWESAQSHKLLVRLENTNLHKDGRIVILESSGVPLLDEDGRLIGYRGIDRDITEPKQIEDALRESRERFKTITASAKDAIIMMDNDGNVSYWNKAAQSIFGHTRQEAMGRYIHTLLAPTRYHEQHFKAFPTFQETGRGAAVGKTVELTAIRKNGEEFPIELSLSAVRVRDEWHAIAIVRDITDRKQAEEKILQQHRFLQHVMDSLTHPFYVVNADNYSIELANAAAREACVYVGSTCYALTHGTETPCHGEDHSCPLVEVKKSRNVVTMEHIHRDTRGNSRFIEIHGYPIFDDGGRVVQMIEYCLDVTDRKWAEEQLRLATRQQIGRSEKLASIGRLAAGIAHEINNPLTGVLTFAHLLRDKESTSKEDRQDLDIIINETARAGDIVRGLLDFAREKTPVKESLDLNHVIDQTIRLIRKQKELEQISIEEDLREGLPNITGDENQLQQVLLNVLLNACEAMPRGGRLTISTSAQDGSVLIKVVDTGCGIKKEHLEQVFEPFFSTKPVGKGTGLGLSVSYGIVEQHGGSLEIESEEGSGTTVTIVLPAGKETGAEDDYMEGQK